MWPSLVQWERLVEKGEGRLLLPKFHDLPVAHGGDSGYFAEIVMAWLLQPCRLLGKAQQWVALWQLV